MARQDGMKMLPLVALLCLAAGQTSAMLMAVDLGSEFLKVSLIKPGRTPIAIVGNEMSKRKTPALVGFANGERLLGEEAASFAVRYPNTVFSRVRELLGRKADDPTIQTMITQHTLPFKVVAHPDTGMAALQVQDNVFSAEELVASLLQYAKQITDAQSGSPVQDAVIAVPAYFGQAQRQALIEAAKLAGLSVLGLINTHTAAALQFGIERDFANKTQHVIFYDMGSGGTEVSLVKYSSYNAKEGGTTKAISQLEVRDVDWDMDVGANTLDAMLADHFAKVFAEKSKVDLQAVLDNPRSMAKLKKQVRRTKEMLSANTGAPISVEEIHDGKDFASSITREDFETMAGTYFDRATAPLKRILDRSGLKPEEIDFVELLGGGTRVPKLQAALSDVLGGRQLDRHLDADEAVVLGASLFAANLSTSFRLRKFGMSELSTYGVSLRIDEVHEDKDEAAAPAGTGDEKLRNLLPYMKKMPVKRVVHFNNLTADPIKFTLLYNTSDAIPHPLPPGVTDPVLATFEVTGVETVIKRYNTSGTVNLKFEAGHDALLSLTKAEAVVEYIVMEEKLVPVKVNGTDNNSTDSTSGGSASSEATKESDGAKADKTEDKESNNKSDSKEGKNTTTESEAPKMEKIQVPKKKTAKVTLNVTSTWAIPPVSGDSLAKAKKQISAWVAAEKAKRQLAAAKNELEAYIIRMKEAMESGQGIAAVTTEGERTSFMSVLNEAEDWLYMEGDAEGLQAFKDKLVTLKKTGDDMEFRAQEAADRPQLIAVARKEGEVKLSTAGLWSETKPWISEEERQSVVDKVKAFLDWLTTKEKVQAAKEPHEHPAVTTKEIVAEYEKLERAFNKVANKKKPKPPPAPPADDKNATSSNKTTEGADGAQAGAGSTQDKPEQQQTEGQGPSEGANEEKATKDEL